MFSKMGEDKSNEAKAEEAKLLLKSILMMAEQKSKEMKKKKESEEAEAKKEAEKLSSEYMEGKSLTKAYLWLIFGGFFGAHHFYLGQDIQGLVTMTTIGGLYGLGELNLLFFHSSNTPIWPTFCQTHQWPYGEVLSM